jgi:hypothetical protein
MHDTDFRQKDCDKYDAITKKEGIALLKIIFKSDEVYKNEDKYDVDLVVKRNDKRLYFEVEYKNFTDLDRITKNGLHISSRKLKYYNDYRKVYHITFLKDYKIALIFHKKTLRNANIIEKNCNRDGDIYNNAKFIEVQIDKAFKLKREQNKWILINSLI